jgi:hypothetical protein
MCPQYQCDFHDQSEITQWENMHIYPQLYQLIQ